MRVEIPLHEASASQADPMNAHLENGESLEGKDIVIVEDNADTSEILKVVLTDQGATVRSAENFDHAMALVQAQWPSLIVSDIGLPGKDGFQLVKALQQAEAAHFGGTRQDRKSTRLNSSHSQISYAVFCLKKKKKKRNR